MVDMQEIIGSYIGTAIVSFLLCILLVLIGVHFWVAAICYIAIMTVIGFFCLLFSMNWALSNIISALMIQEKHLADIRDSMAVKYNKEVGCIEAVRRSHVNMEQEH